MLNESILRSITVPPETLIREAAKIIQTSPVKIVLVCDSDKTLLGTLTDGDIRRAVLDFADLSGNVATIMNKNPKVLRPEESPHAAREYMRNAVIRHLPRVNERGQIVDLILLDGSDDVMAQRTAVVLMAGGRGQRLMPLTRTTPKPLLMVGRKPVLQRQIEQLIGHGFSRFYISINYLGNMIEEFFGDGRQLGIEIKYLRETKALGTAGALSLMGDIDVPLLVMNGDIVSKANFAELVRYFEDDGVAATMGVREYLYTVPYGCVKLNGAVIERFEEKPTFRHLVNAGIYVVSPKALTLVPKDEQFDMPELFDRLIEAGQPTNTFQITEEWIDIGQKEDLDWARRVFAVEDRND